MEFTLTLKILNKDTLLIFSKLVIMPSRKSGKVLNLLYLWEVKAIMTHQHQASMKKISLQILFLLPMILINSIINNFSTAAQKVKSNIKFYSKSFSDFLPPNIHESIILSQVTEDEVSKIISSLNSSKSIDPNSILQVQI